MAPARKSVSVINYIIVDLPAPPNLSFAWRFGSILGLILRLQIGTGLFLAIHYGSDLIVAFDSVAHINRELRIGWFARRLHANGASIFFILLYAHILRGLIIGSFKKKDVWLRGVSLFLLSIAIAFMGYLLPWGQISYWGATVITNLVSVIPYIGPFIVEWLWGGFSVGGATLQRFFVGHFILPFLLTGVVFIHLFRLHKRGSNNPLSPGSGPAKTAFHPYYPAKDLVGFVIIIIILILLTIFYPNRLGDPENWLPANRMVTPTHIKPEWYFLWAYAILRSIPNKVGGVVAIVRALLLIYSLPYGGNVRRMGWFMAACLVILSWVGASPVEPPFILVGQLLTFFYFLLIIIIITFL